MFITDILIKALDELMPETEASGDVAAVNTEPPKKIGRGMYASLSRPADCSSRHSQVDRYLNGEFGLDSSIENPIEFWISRRTQLPVLSRLALKVLSVPATSAPVERVFSHGGLITKPNRASLSDSNITKLILLKCNRLNTL